MTRLEIRDFTEAYTEFHMDKARRLGEGGFAKVYLVRSRADNAKWAAKYQKPPNPSRRRLIREEAEKLAGVQHAAGQGRELMSCIVRVKSWVKEGSFKLTADSRVNIQS